ncbi:MAG: UDP-N-acetylmuramoyl-L-alanyl-D-glutamate--2,6-diaminopimelate ligase, partial [Clostridia bacterium]|nr:UDP-N-acetylmuramoyl-L-alanyl-D-glutamate--2,6-diaminopimelate ligase [Clostridia bacterium]
AGINSDIIYLTEEDPNMEPVRKISEDIAQYAERNCDKVYFVDDRNEAIRRAIFESSDNAIILLTAKGRETRQKRMGEYVDCVSDVDLTEAFLALYDKISKKDKVRV